MSRLSMPGGGPKRRALVFALPVLLAAGCGGLKAVPVGGKVTLNGQPFQEGGQILFTPDESRGNQHRASCKGPIKDGRYELETVGVTQSESGPGAPVGWYKVTWIPPAAPPPSRAGVRAGASGAAGPPRSVNKNFLHANTTPLSVEVKANPAPDAYDINFTP